MYVTIPFKNTIYFGDGYFRIENRCINIQNLVDINPTTVCMRVDPDVLDLLKREHPVKVLLERKNLICYPDMFNIQHIINIVVMEDGVWKIFTELEGKKYLTTTIQEPMRMEKVCEDEYNVYPIDDRSYIRAMDTPGMSLTDEQYENMVGTNAYSQTD